MERHEVETFLALAEELHFGRTAERLHVSTARVSQTIRKLERRIGAPLFDRTSRRVTLTQQGARFHDDLLPAYRQVQAAFLAARVRAGTARGLLRVGFVGAATGQLALRAADAMQKRRPDCVVELRELQLDNAVAGVRAADVDVLLGCLPVEEPELLTGAPLLSETWTLAVSIDHPFVRRHSVTVDDLAVSEIVRAPCPLPRTWYDPAAAPEEQAASGNAAGMQAQTLQEALTLVGAGKGAFPVGEHTARFHRRPDIAYVPIVDAPLLQWGVVRRAEAAPNVDAFVSVVEEAARRHELGAQPPTRVRRA